MSILFFKNPAKKNGILLLETEGACLCRPISWNMPAMLGNSAEHSGQTSGMRKWVHFWQPRQFPAQNFKGKHRKQPVSRKIYEKKLKSS